MQLLTASRAITTSKTEALAITAVTVCSTMNQQVTSLSSKERLAKLEAIEKELATALSHAGAAMAELAKEKDAEKKTIIDVWKVPILLKLSLILYYTWFAHAFLSYASFFTTEALGGSFFMNLTVLATFDILAYLGTLSVFNRLPRQRTIVWGIVVEVVALTCLLIACLFENTLVYRLIASIVYRAALHLVLNMYYLYSAETFPTAMRQASLGVCSLAARAGSVVAPFVRELTNFTHLSVTVAVFLSLISLNLLFVLFLPDTGKIQVADTIGQKRREVEMKVAQRSKSISSAESFQK